MKRKLFYFSILTLLQLTLKLSAQPPGTGHNNPAQPYQPRPVRSNAGTKIDISPLVSKLQTSANEITSLTAAKARLEQDLEKIRKQLTNEAGAHARINEEYEKLKTESANKEVEISRLNVTMQENKTKFDAMNAQYQNLSAAYEQNIKEKKELEENKNQEITDMKIANLKFEEEKNLKIDSLNVENEKIAEEGNKSLLALQAFQAKESELQKAKLDLEKQLGDLNNRVARSLESEAATKTKLATTTQDILEILAKLDKANAAIERLTQENEELNKQKIAMQQAEIDRENEFLEELRQNRQESLVGDYNRLDNFESTISAMYGNAEEEIQNISAIRDQLKATFEHYKSKTTEEAKQLWEKISAIINSIENSSSTTMEIEGALNQSVISDTIQKVFMKVWDDFRKVDSPNSGVVLHENQLNALYADTRSAIFNFIGAFIMNLKAGVHLNFDNLTKILDETWINFEDLKNRLLKELDERQSYLTKFQEQWQGLMNELSAEKDSIENGLDPDNRGKVNSN